MKATIIFAVFGIYLVLAFVIARFCAVNAGWEKIADLIPKQDDKKLAVPEKKNLSGPGDVPGPGDVDIQGV